MIREWIRPKTIRLILPSMILATFLLVLVACTTPVEPEATPTPVRQIGSATTCYSTPPFVDQFDLPNLAIDTTQTLAMGMALRDLDSGEIIQHDTWTQAGAVGPYSRDVDGNVYLAPVPFVLQNEPVETDQNRVLKVDGVSGDMAQFVALPGSETETGNPYGATGLAYDCDTNRLYAASLAGSSRDAEVGAIYVIDLDTASIIDQIEGVDALATVVFNGSGGKRLYYGSARTPDIFSIALDETGNFSGEPRFEFSLAQLSQGSVENGVRLQITDDDQMIVKAYLFNYAPITSGGLVRDVYTLDYDAENDSWNLVSIAQETQ